MHLRSIVSSAAAAALLSCLAMSPAAAQHGAVADAPHQQLQASIRHGIASGRITPQEAHRLQQREHELRVREHRMHEDGRATPQERRQLRQEIGHLQAEVDLAIAGRRVASVHDGRTPGIDREQRMIHARIEHGIRSGLITRREAERLSMRERQLRRLEADFKADGHVSRIERRQLHEEIAVLDGDVERMLANGRRY